MDSLSQFHSILERAIERKATDVHLGADLKPSARIDGDIVFLAEFAIQTKEDLGTITRKLLDQEQYKRFLGGKEIDGIFSYGDMRFRLNAYQERRGANLALRHLKRFVPTYEELGLPGALKDLVALQEGLLLIVGPTGAGKTTTRSALINYINETHQKHIISLEDVIEYHYESKKSLIKQRTIGPDGDSASYPDALVAAMRQDPDIISIGDMRDYETMALALSAAQTGHFIIAEIHASSASHAISRIIDSAPAGDRLKIQEELAQYLVGAIAQRLIPKIDGGLALAFELLLTTTAVKTLIRDNAIERIPDVIRTNADKQMILLEESIRQLVHSHIVSFETIKEFRGLQDSL